ncbi:hypothetical protein LCGC14_0466850 [marine sediment metagenome]|uniref:Uncharacterized protein n=1 Tax=marine sediment metagenome TaxID=412755 RepID=A0A0F9SDH6_9ZZZZ
MTHPESKVLKNHVFGAWTDTCIFCDMPADDLRVDSDPCEVATREQAEKASDFTPFGDGVVRS